MDNREAARAVFRIAALLEAQGANRFRVAAYRRSALGLLALPDEASRYLSPKGELLLPWLGPSLRRKLGELIKDGRMRFHDELLAELPPAMRALLEVPGIGPRTARRLVTELGIKSVRGLARAARQQRLRRLHGIGPVRERRLGQAAEALLGKAA